MAGDRGATKSSAQSRQRESIAISAIANTETIGWVQRSHSFGP